MRKSSPPYFIAPKALLIGRKKQTSSSSSPVDFLPAARHFIENVFAALLAFTAPLPAPGITSWGAMGRQWRLAPEVKRVFKSYSGNNYMSSTQHAASELSAGHWWVTDENITHPSADYKRSCHVPRRGWIHKGKLNCWCSLVVMLENTHPHIVAVSWLFTLKI